MRHIEWLNLNSKRAYPIKEDSGVFDTSGNFAIPTEFLVDAVISVNTNVIEKLYIKQITFLPDLITVVLYNQDDEITCSTTIPVASHTVNDYYILQGHGDYLETQGKLVVGEIPTVVGTYEFTAELESRTIIPNLRGVSSISVYKNNTTDTPLNGHVKLIEGFNIKLSYDYSKNGIRIDALEGAGLGTGCVCPEENIPPGDPIKFINGVPPDSGYNFNVQGVGCITVEAIENGIRVSNTCEEICCDCEDLEDIQTTVNSLLSLISALDDRVRTLENCPP